MPSREGRIEGYNDLKRLGWVVIIKQKDESI